MVKYRWSAPHSGATGATGATPLGLHSVQI